MTTATRGEAGVTIAASPDDVYDLITDITRIGERSPECYRAEWLDGATRAEVGARFRGHNRIGPIRWATTCIVTKADRGREFTFTVVNPRDREETMWRYALTADEGGTTVTESYEFLWCPWLARVAEIPFPRDKQLRRGIKQTLAALKAAAEAEATVGRP
jgi:uncharacterized protein YndB with AHSA1/START domain